MDHSDHHPADAMEFRTAAEQRLERALHALEKLWEADKLQLDTQQDELTSLRREREQLRQENRMLKLRMQQSGDIMDELIAGVEAMLVEEEA